MLRRTRVQLSLLTVAALLMGTSAVPLSGPTPAAAVAAQESCPRMVWTIIGYDDQDQPQYGYVSIDPCASSNPGNPGSPRPNTCQHAEHGEFDCTHPTRGWWSSSRSCYVRLMSPQPPAGDPLWGSNDPTEGAFYIFSCPLAPQSANDYYEVEEFLTEAPGAPSVAQLAQRAVESLTLEVPTVGIAPSPGGVGLVGVPVWLWVENTDGGWGPVGPQCVSGPGITVCAQATAIRVRWDMGNGDTETCDDPGTPYRPEFGADEPDCGYTYTRPSSTQSDGRYHITAETEWHVQWWVSPQGSGAEDEDFTFRESPATSIQINELQVVTS